jgi:hypothetical protein
MAIAKARRFLLTLDTTNLAFKYPDGPAGPELARLLRQIADDVERVDDAQLLRNRNVKDCNGEVIGGYVVMFQ